MATDEQKLALADYQKRFVNYTFGGEEPPSEVVADIKRIVESRKKKRDERQGTTR